MSKIDYLGFTSVHFSRSVVSDSLQSNYTFMDVCICPSGKESACNAGDPSLIPGLGRSSGEGIGYPLQYSWASLVAQLVKNLPTIQETPG